MRLAFFVILLAILPVILGLRDPYQILGVPPTATLPIIKKAYKNLAKEWHPDKSSDPTAGSRFVEITQAYELLADPERRALYDQHGITEDTPNFRQRPDYGQFRRMPDHFDSFFTTSGFKFDFKFEQGTVYHKQTITSRTYSNVVLANSSQKPYLILFYSDWCLPCLQAEMLWNKIAEEMEPLGMGIATIHAEVERALARKLGASQLPHLALVMDNRVYHYKENQLSLIRTIDFVKSKFPYRMVVPVDDGSVAEFLDGWIDNRVRVMVFSRRESIRLRYLLAAFQFRANVAFGYVQLGKDGTEGLVERYHVPSNMDTLLLFKEDGDVPVASMSMPDISASTMRDIIGANKYLLLPRLSSQDMFDQLCPPDASLLRKRLCIVLVTRNIPAHNPYRQALRDYLQDNPLPSDRVQFTYIFADRQEDFVKALMPENDTVEELGLVIMWRKNHNTLQYRWLQDVLSVDSDRVNVSDNLYDTVNALLKSTDSISPDAVVKMLVDEHVLSIFSRLILKLVTVTQYVKENITREEALPAISVLLTIGFVVIGGYFVSYLVKMEEETVTQKFRDQGKDIPGVPKKIVREVPLLIHELRGETYNGLVKLLKPGCRTIVLLVNSETKNILYPTFYKICYPYRRNKSLMFAFLLLEKNLEWYRRLLIQTLAEPRDLNINPKNCIGTVLSLNGHRKYFCMYHAKYLETFKSGVSMKKRMQGGGDFMGFEDSSESSDTEVSDVEAGPKIHTQSLIKPSVPTDASLLDGFPNWLDRLFEGSTQRYYLQFWPIMK